MQPELKTNSRELKREGGRPVAAAYRQHVEPLVLHQRLAVGRHAAIRVALLTGGGDRPYALGMAAALT